MATTSLDTCSTTAPVRDRSLSTETLPLGALRAIEDSDSSVSGTPRQRHLRLQTAAHLVQASRSYYTVPSEALLQSIVDQCCAKAAASGCFREFTDCSGAALSLAPPDEHNFLSQCAALSEALSRTSESHSSAFSSSRCSRSRSHVQPRRVVSGSLPRQQSLSCRLPSHCHTVSASPRTALLESSAAVRDAASQGVHRSRTRTR
jgi:hypothetical protein